MKKVLVLIIIVLLVVIYVGCQQVSYANARWERAEANVKSYASLFDETKQRNAALQLTASQLSYFKDSVLQELDATRKELKIKDKNLKALQAVSSSFHKSDTVVFVDTLFKDPQLRLDTILGDGKWYTAQLALRYPSTVVMQPMFRSEKHIVVSQRKETVNPPKKFFLFRWFQKRHYVIQVDVVEKNPYVDNESSRYIEIIK